MFFLHFQSWRTKFLPYLLNRMSINVLHLAKCFIPLIHSKSSSLRFSYLLRYLSYFSEEWKYLSLTFSKPYTWFFYQCLISGPFVTKERQPMNRNFLQRNNLQKLGCRMIFFFLYELYIKIESWIQKTRHLTKKTQLEELDLFCFAHFIGWTKKSWQLSAT